MGGTASIATSTAELQVAVDAENPDALLVKIDVQKNGEIWQTITPNAPTYEAALVDGAVTGDGYYRLEVTSLDTSTGRYYFAWSNPIFVDME